MALPVTAAPYEAPYETLMVRLGRGGLDLRDAPDAADPTAYQKLTNVYHENGGDLYTRAGLTSLGTAGAGEVHSFARLRNVAAGTFTRLVGGGTSLYGGVSGALAAIDAGYSGDPLTMVPARPPQSGSSWMLVADRSRMRKVRSDLLDLPIGLPAPAAAVTTALVTEQKTDICLFEVTDGSEAAAWTGNAGEDYADPPVATDAPIANDVPAKVGAGAVDFVTVPGAATEGYWSFWGHALAKNLSKVGTRDASDSDVLHLWLKLSDPAVVDEVRFYLVTDAVFDPTVLPGTSATSNRYSYMKAFRQNDFAQMVSAAGTQVDGAENAATIQAWQDRLKERGYGRVVDREPRQDEAPYTPPITDRRASWKEVRARVDSGRQVAQQMGAGVHEWVEYGIIGVPLRRGDFQRIGAADGPDWSSVTGIVIYISTNSTIGVALTLDDLYMTGGYGPDTVEPGATQIDLRATNYDPRTGAESNGSPIQDEANWLDAIRRGIDVTPAAYGDADVRQRFYQRGGSVLDDWYYIGTNDADGGVFTAEATDLEVVAGDPLAIDHYQPVPTEDTDGNTVLAQPVRSIWGPVMGVYFACGDPYRPGHVYWCLPDAIDHWGASTNAEVCAPSEELMAGCAWGGQGYVFSRQRLYALYLSTDSTDVTPLPTQCAYGLVSPWGLTVAPGGIAFVCRDGVGLTTGGTPDWLSDPPNGPSIKPLFLGRTVHGYSPIDFDEPEAINLEIHQNELWFQYQDTLGVRQTLIYSLTHRYWRAYVFTSHEITSVFSEEMEGGSALLLGAKTGGSFYTHEGVSDAGSAIVCAVWTAEWNAGRPREEKLLGDLFVDLDRAGVDISVTVRLNAGVDTDAAQSLVSEAGRTQYVLDPFGTVPQSARSVGVGLAWSTASGRPILSQVGVSVIPQPDIVIRRATQWDVAGHPYEKYLIGCVVEADTRGDTATLVFEYTLDGTIYTAATKTITSDGRGRWYFSWPVVKADLVRVRPGPPLDECKLFQLFRLDWIATEEPPRIAGWDTGWEDHGDTYYTGLDIECDTYGVNKTVQVYIDQVLQGTYTVNADGRRHLHLTLNPPSTGHIYRFVATDANPGLLYSHKWYLVPEPSEQTNWNQAFTVLGSMAEKIIKGVGLQCNTNALAKTVEVQVDGATVETLTVTQTGRGIQYFAFPRHRGRVFRLLPTDANPGKLYEPPLWIFDEDPIALDRWETQETDHQLPQRHTLVYAEITLRSTAQVDLTTTAHRPDGTTQAQTYAIATTGGVKRKVWVPFDAMAGVLWHYLFTSTVAFNLYREESHVYVLPWGADQPVMRTPFGNDDLDGGRAMHTGVGLAQAAGGGV